MERSVDVISEWTLQRAQQRMLIRSGSKPGCRPALMEQAATGVTEAVRASLAG